MEHPPISTFFIPPDPSPTFPQSSRSVDLSPLEFVLALIALVTIPALMYTFFFSIKFPSSPFRRRSSTTTSQAASTAHPSPRSSFSDAAEEKSEVNSGSTSSDLKYQKDTHGNEIGSECPVCLSVFADGEEVRQLKECRHSFHTACIDLWLNSHANCPVCRGPVAVANKRPPPQKTSNGPSSSTTTASASRSRNQPRDDFHQGMPDASSLV